jgi:hypothetical protein
MPRERYTVQEASDLTGLAVSTLKQYPFTTDLVRGEDFYVHRFARFRRRTYWTARGIARLKTRSYRVDKQYREASFHARLPLPRRYDGTSVQEIAARLFQRIRLALYAYKDSPCAVPNCPCMTHRLGLPQADEIAAVMAMKAEARKRNKK